MIRPKTWALVMNGDQARILRGLEKPGGDAPETIELTSPAGVTHRRDHLEDRTGRSFSSGAAGRRSAMEPGTDPVRRDMEEFAREALDHIEKHLKAKAFDKLAVIAAPAMLGLLRDKYSPALRETITFETAANLIPVPAQDLRTTVLEMMRRETAG